MVTTDLIKKTCESPQGFKLRTIVEFLIEIGNESLDPSKEYTAGGWIAIGGAMPLHQVWPPKEGKYPFHIKDLITDKCVPDPRVTMIGRYLYQYGGLNLMQRVYNGMNELGYKGSLRALDYAWNGIGSWQA